MGMKTIKTTEPRFEQFLKKIANRDVIPDVTVETTVRRIIADVARRGDRAVFKYTRMYDRYILDEKTIEVSSHEWNKAVAEAPGEAVRILNLAAKRIREFHKNQRVQDYRMTAEKGIILGQRITPLDRIGIYAPGGLAAYPSTVLMAAIPAGIAGVREIILVSPTKEGRLNPLIAAAARISGVNRIFKIGGAQAIAALAYGTDLVSRVDKIVGPGNAYVAAAKRMVFGRVDIDMIAGPSEVLIIADGGGSPSFAAADMIAQAEHDAMASAVLLTPDAGYAEAVKAELSRQLKSLPKRDIAGRSLKSYGAVIITRNLAEAADIANRFAPEHLELMVKNPRQLLTKIRHAGAIFMGGYTPEALGDYMAGPNHILPTGGTARFSSPLGVYDFIKRTSILSFSREAFGRYSLQTERFAQMEGLDGHGNSVKVRTGG